MSLKYVRCLYQFRNVTFFVNLVNQFDFSDKLLTLQNMWIVYSVYMFFVKIFWDLDIIFQRTVIKSKIVFLSNKH